MPVAPFHVPLDDPIAAISTPPGHAGLGVVRISGAGARDCVERVVRWRKEGMWQPWTARYADLVDETGEVIDNVVVTFFAAPRSYTAEDVVEISCHGAPVVLRFCLERLIGAGARLAEPGEFTLRAFVNGRIDLPQAEAVRDLIAATTLYQARVAAQQVDGSVSRRLAPIKRDLLDLIALLEAGIDFADDDVSVASDDEIMARIAGVRGPVERLVTSFHFGRLVQEGVALAIVGRPNVGKSSLFNRLLDRDRAIVTDIPGTTRDAVSESISLGGLPLRLMDTAGVRETEDTVERLGVERTMQAIADADLVVVVLAGSEPLSAGDEELIARAARAGRHLVVRNKADLPQLHDAGLPVSALDGRGIDELRAAILDNVGAAASSQEPGFITSLRHEQLLRETLRALAAAERAVCSRIPHEMVLLDLYSALRPVDAITGATTADDILNRIFTTFCIGK